MPPVLRKLVLLAVAAASPAFAEPDLAQVEKIVVEETNRFRREQGLEETRPDRALEKAATAFAEYMARTDKYGHEADGRTPAQRARSHGYDYCLVSENISYQYSSQDFRTAELARRYVEGWKGSPGHRRNMLAPHATETAVAVVRGARSGRYYAVQMFGRPRSARVEFRITNRGREPARYRVGDEAFSLASGSTRIHEQCGPEDISLAGGEAMRVAAGDRFAITQRPGGRLVLRREP